MLFHLKVVGASKNDVLKPLFMNKDLKTECLLRYNSLTSKYTGSVLIPVMIPNPFIMLEAGSTIEEEVLSAVAYKATYSGFTL